MSRKAMTGLVILVVSLGLYLTSLSMDVARVERTVAVFGVGKSETTGYSLLRTIQTLYEDGHLGLAAIITSFTLVFPIGKYLALGYVYLGRRERWRQRLLLWVKNLGQWSMGDVFVVALMVVIVRFNGSVAQLSIEPRPGLWVFAGSVLLSMVASALLGFDRRQGT